MNNRIKIIARAVFVTMSTTTTTTNVHHRPVKVTIVSDIVWPFCYIGLRHLEAASAQSQIPVTLEWKPFLLNPTMVDEGQNLMDHLVQKYGPAAVANFNDPQSSHLHQMGRAVSIQFNNDRKMVNTLQAHALVEAVKESQGNDVANRLMEHLYQLYFE
jgi:predicted DsbA family dithiol-disulfide isomerase